MHLFDHSTWYIDSHSSTEIHDSLVTLEKSCTSHTHIYINHMGIAYIYKYLKHINTNHTL